MDPKLNNSFQTTFVVKKIFFNNKTKSGNFKFSPDVGVAFNKLSESEWETTINVRVLDKEDSPFPFDLDVSVAMITAFPKVLPTDFDLKQYLKINSLNILFPYVRSLITNVTSDAMVAPLYLPIVDIGEMSKNIEIPGL